MVGYIANVAEQYHGFQPASSEGDPHFCLRAFQPSPSTILPRASQNWGYWGGMGWLKREKWEFWGVYVSTLVLIIIMWMFKVMFLFCITFQVLVLVLGIIYPHLSLDVWFDEGDNCWCSCVVWEVLGWWLAQNMFCWDIMKYCNQSILSKFRLHPSNIQKLP